MLVPSPRVSIVVATFNAAAHLERCLDSIFSQHFTDWELLVFDGGSQDGTIDIIRRYASRIAYWQSQPDGGIYDAWNQALARAQGEYICFLGADDAWSDVGTLSCLFTAIGDSEYDLVTSQGFIFEPGGGKGFVFGSPWSYIRMQRRMVVCHPGLLHRRVLFDIHGPFDSRFRITGDYDFLLRLPADLRTLHVDTPSVLIEAGGISRTQIFRRLREQREAMRRCPRIGPVRAYLVWFDKLWRYPVARLLGLSY